MHSDCLLQIDKIVVQSDIYLEITVMSYSITAIAQVGRFNY